MNVVQNHPSANTTNMVRVVVPPDVRTFQYDPRRAGLPPRDYQIELIDDVWQAVLHAQPGERHGLSLATGGGKTRILVDVLFFHVLSMGARVLWLAPDWELVAQAIDDACARYREARGLITYIGGSGTVVPLFGAPRAPGALLTFTTLQTFFARRDTAFANESFDLVVLDEVHYGEHGKLQQQVYGRYENTAIFLGATGRPRRAGSTPTTSASGATTISPRSSNAVCWPDRSSSRWRRGSTGARVSMAPTASSPRAQSTSSPATKRATR